MNILFKFAYSKVHKKGERMERKTNYTNDKKTLVKTFFGVSAVMFFGLALTFLAIALIENTRSAGAMSIDMANRTHYALQSIESIESSHFGNFANSNNHKLITEIIETNQQIELLTQEIRTDVKRLRNLGRQHYKIQQETKNHRPAKSKELAKSRNELIMAITKLQNDKGNIEKHTIILNQLLPKQRFDELTQNQQMKTRMRYEMVLEKLTHRKKLLEKVQTKLQNLIIQIENVSY